VEPTVSTLRERADAMLDAALADLRASLPASTTLFDAHVHVGTDIDGFVAPLDRLLAFLDDFGAARAFAFCLDEPDRAPAFRAANDRTLAAAGAANGVLVPFVRLDVREDPIREAERALDAGGRGIKLHPRSQGFSLGHHRLEPIVAVAAERAVPILIHGGRGLPPIADDLARLADRYPSVQLIVAHAGIADLAGLTAALGGRPGLFFDTSVWSGLDLLDLFSRVGPEQVIYASDYPYGQQPGSLALAVRMARHAGFDDGQVQAMLGGTASAIADGREPATPTRPVGSGRIDQPLTYARLHHYMAMCSPMLWARQPDHVGVLGLAVNTCLNAHDADRDVLTRIGELLDLARRLWNEAMEVEDAEARWRELRQVMRLVHLADVETLTATG
jgi:predicted TIM-barrel fold metal-dependent hydrolase